MTEVVVVAAGGLARETIAAVRRTGLYEVIGLVDDDPALWGEWVADLPVVGGLDRLQERPEADIVLCAGHGRSRAELAGRIAGDESRYAIVLDSSVNVPRSCTVGAGSVLLAGVVLTDSVIVGRHVVVMPNATLTHDVVVGDYATICSGVSVAGGVSVGVGAYIGMNACIREDVVIGEGATVGMGSVVLCDVGPGETWVGSPARRRPQPSASAEERLSDPPAGLRVVPQDIRDRHRADVSRGTADGARASGRQRHRTPGVTG